MVFVSSKSSIANQKFAVLLNLELHGYCVAFRHRHPVIVIHYWYCRGGVVPSKDRPLGSPSIKRNHLCIMCEACNAAGLRNFLACPAGRPGSCSLVTLLSTLHLWAHPLYLLESSLTMRCLTLITWLSTELGTALVILLEYRSGFCDQFNLFGAPAGC